MHPNGLALLDQRAHYLNGEVLHTAPLVGDVRQPGGQGETRVGRVHVATRPAHDNAVPRPVECVVHVHEELGWQVGESQRRVALHSSSRGEGKKKKKKE